jgi:signal transduction histidine kinase
MGRISLSVDAAMSDTVSVKVTDTGSGMAPQQLAQIQAARRWATADDSAEPARFSRGLGLQIVGSIAELHGAHLQIDTELGRGTTVELLFPKSPPGHPDHLWIEFPLRGQGRNPVRITET